jgi:hypothetical protein
MREFSLSGLLLGCQLEGPQRLLHALEVVPRLVNSVYQVLDTDHALITHQLFDEDVVSDRGSRVVSLPEEASLADEFVDHLLGREAPSQLVLDDGELFGELVTGLEENNVEDLLESEAGEDLLGLGRRVLTLVHSHDHE